MKSGQFMRGYRMITGLAIFLLASGAWQCNSPFGKSGEALRAGFVNPPDSARPRVWWHWMNGNITKEGIRADLEWMHRVGIGGFQNFDASLNTPQIVEKRLVYMTPEWKEAFRFTTRLADSLGLEMAIAGSPGWSESGGPWVKPAEAMKKYVWSETRVEGGKPFKGILTLPPRVTGTFQNLPSREYFSRNEARAVPPPEFYADAAVVAYRLPAADLSMDRLAPKVFSSGGKFDLASLTDGDLATKTLLPYAKPGENAWILFEFPQAETMVALTIVGGGYPGMWGRGGDRAARSLEASDNGREFRKIMDIPPRGVEQRTLTFDPVTAKYFRFAWKTPVPQPGQNTGAAGVPAGTGVSELVLHKVARVNRFEEKAAFSTASDLYKSPTPEVRPEEAVQKTEVIDLTAMMQPDGTLEWTPPAGNWMVIRLGYSLTGHRNSPASPEATGLEVDKLNAAYVKDYFDNYLDQYKDATGGLMGKKGLQFVITDSWEAGTQNWTDNMMKEFAVRRGYSMLPWIPVLTGHIVGSSEASDRFLWDFRRTLADLVAENHYDQLTEILRERGMKRYTESHEGGRAFIGDGMEVKRKAAIPMSATWTPAIVGSTEISAGYQADVRESASVSHIYGQNLVAAESMTAIGTAWAWSPETLKPTADMEMANGLNRFVIHTSVHQPVNDKIPGLGLGPYGQWFTRHETWAEQAGAWIKYLTRSSWMLQQGTFVADILWFYGEDNNITALFGQKLPDIPEGYNYDFVNSDALVNVLTTRDGLIRTPGGTTYKVLALDANSRQMSLPVLRKIRELVQAGAVVCGEKPATTPSLSDNQPEFDTLVRELWPDGKGEKQSGKGRIYAGQPLHDVLLAEKIAPDFKHNLADSSRVLFVHRKAGNTDFYWVNSRQLNAADVEATFRVSGREAEIWHPETGAMEPVSYTSAGGHTRIKLHLQPEDAVFVVFAGKSSEKEKVLVSPKEELLTVIEGPWEISFQEKRGAPPQAVFDSLKPWNESADAGIKYFSGTAAYHKNLNAPATWFEKEAQLLVDLGNVKNLAEVVLNGKSLGVLWKTPFRVDITGTLRQGENILEIRVTNLWVNRLIGDQQPGVSEKFTYTTMPFYQADSPLKPSGLLGPVQILRVKS